MAPTRKIRDLLAAGELNGLDPCDVPLDTARGWIREERRRRAGKVQGRLAGIPHRDAIESLRLELLACADKVIQNEKRRGANGDLERLRQAARVIREAAAIPEKHEPRPPRPNEAATGGRLNGQEPGGLAGQILAAHGRRVGTASETASENPHLDVGNADTEETETTTPQGTGYGGGADSEVAQQLEAPHAQY